MTRKRFMASLLALALLACKSAPTAAPQLGENVTPGGAPAGPAGAPKKIRTIEGITEYALGNGMQVLLFPDNSKDTVTVNLTYKVGSRHEGAGETGMAHLLEHMMFKGSKGFTGLDKQMGKRGASYNASTSYDRTEYHETMPASADNLAWALAMEADRMVNAFIKQEDLSSEFSVVRNEMEAGENDPLSILVERMLSTAYLWHNYGKSTIGARSDVERVPATTLRKFYVQYYQPDNAVLIVAGKFDAEKTLTVVNQTFGAIPRPTRQLPPTYTVEPVQDGERTVTLRRVGDVGLVGLVYHTVAGSHPDEAGVEAIADLLAAEPSGRLYKALVPTGMATRVIAEPFGTHDPGVLMLMAEVPAGKPLEPVQAKMIEIVEGLGSGKDKVTDEEVTRFRAKEKKNAKLLFASSGALSGALAEAVALGDWRLVFLGRDHNTSVKVADVQRVATTYLKSSNRTLGLFVPDKNPNRAPLTERPDVNLLVKDYNGKPPIAEGEAFVYTLSNIEKRTTRSKLKSGLAWALLPKETRGDAVRARLTLHYGVEKDFKGRVEAAELMGPLLRRGTKKHSFQQLSDELDALEAEVDFSSGMGQLSVAITTNRDNLAAVLTLVDEILRQPAFPADELETIRKQQLTDLDAAKSEPQALAVTSFRRKLFPYPKDHVNYVPTLDEKIERVKAVKLDDIKKLHALIGASSAQLVVVGDFDAKLIGDKATALWGEWKSPKPFKRIEQKLFPSAGSSEVIDTPDKENAMLIAGLGLALRDTDPDFAALELVNHVLGGGGFSSRLMKRLREKEGLSYFTTSQFQADAFDPVGVLVCVAILAPQNAAKGLAGLVEEVDHLAGGGVTADELAQAKASYVKEFERQLSSDSFVAGQLEDALYVGRTLDYFAQLNAKISALSLEQVNAAAKKYVKPGALIKVTGADQKKATAGKK